MLTPPLSFLSDAAQAALAHAYVPYSGTPEAVVVMDASGRWVPGVRVESASFSLTIPATRNALTTAAALGLGPIVATATSAPLSAADQRELAEAAPALQADGPLTWSHAGVLPTPHPQAASPFLDVSISTPEEGLALARQVASRAVVPASNFPVGCVAVLADGRAVAGVNVERAAWPDILCAERNALGTLVSYGLGPATTLYVVCVRAACSPCGACRQVIAELAPEGEIWMHRDTTPLVSSAAALLPDHFKGSTLSR